MPRLKTIRSLASFGNHLTQNAHGGEDFKTEIITRLENKYFRLCCRRMKYPTELCCHNAIRPMEYGYKIRGAK